MSADLSEMLFNALNEQGYLFQEKCCEILKSMEKTTGWKVEGYDYPVSMRDQETKIDIVLKDATQGDPELYALIECKRSDPEYVRWLFSASTAGRALCYATTFKCRDVLSDRPMDIARIVSPRQFELWTYDVKNWMEVKKDARRKPSTPQNIENAFIQVLKGVGGFGREQLGQRTKKHSPFEVSFIPIVITTASIYVAGYKPEDIDIRTGTIQKNKVFFGT